MPAKSLCNELSLYKFSVPVDTFILLYQVATDLEIETLVLEICFLTTRLKNYG